MFSEAGHKRRLKKETHRKEAVDFVLILDLNVLKEKTE